MLDKLYLPVTDPREVEEVLEGLPMALDRDHFLEFALGFPKKYLSKTSRIEIVKHYFLVQGLEKKPVISSLSRQQDLWKLALVTGDRSFLFSRIVASLSCLGLNILSAEAFANASSLVLDTFFFSDPEGHFKTESGRQECQHLLEDVVEGKLDVETLLLEREEQLQLPADQSIEVSLDNESHPTTTRLRLRCTDHFGLLYHFSYLLNREGCSIEMAYIQTLDGMADDEFYIVHEGQPLSEQKCAELAELLENSSLISSLPSQTISRGQEVS